MKTRNSVVALVLTLILFGCKTDPVSPDAPSEEGKNAVIAVIVTDAYIEATRNSIPSLQDAPDRSGFPAAIRVPIPHDLPSPILPLLPEDDPFWAQVGEALEASVMRMTEVPSSNKQVTAILLTDPTCLYCPEAKAVARKLSIPIFDVSSRSPEDRARFAAYELIPQPVEGLPCWVFFADGKEVGRKSGRLTEQQVQSYIVGTCEQVNRSKATEPMVSSFTVNGPTLKIADWIKPFKGMKRNLGEVATIEVPANLTWKAVRTKDNTLIVTLNPPPSITWKKFIVQFNPSLNALEFAPGWETVTARLGGVLPDIRIRLDWGL